MPATVQNIIFWSAASCIFALLLFFGIDFAIYTPPHTGAGISPSTYPRMVAILLFCTSLYLVLESCLHHKRAQAQKPDVEDAGEPHAKRKLLSVCVIIPGYYASIEYLGIVMASTLAFVLLTRLTGERRTGRMLCIGAAVAAGLYYFFLYAAAVPMPEGLFGGIL